MQNTIQQDLFDMDREYVATVEVKHGKPAITWNKRVFLLRSDNQYVEIDSTPALSYKDRNDPKRARPLDSRARDVPRDKLPSESRTRRTRRG